ncbi:hypothetical protein ACFQ36_11160 [Arthrobacter sp. GCM10027362]|uniref:hypothetical protein n=1 Tax=Arthrobacter sp. GCM10027362 TaxID=3273379 RepID=UPI0036390F8F
MDPAVGAVLILAAVAAAIIPAVAVTTAPRRRQANRDRADSRRRFQEAPFAERVDASATRKRSRRADSSGVFPATFGASEGGGWGGGSSCDTGSSFSGGDSGGGGGCD